MIGIDLVDFSPIFELAATLNVAFVAVEYAQSYTVKLSQKLFKFEETIEGKFKECLASLPDKETLNSLSPVRCGAGDTSLKIESAKRSLEVIQKEAGDVKMALKEEVASECTSRSHSALSLFLFLMCVIIVLTLPYHNAACWTNSFAIFVVLSLVYLIAGWVFGENKKPRKVCDFTSFKSTILYALLILIVSNVVGVFVSIRYDVFFGLLILSTIVPFANFMIYILLLKRKAKTINKSIKNKIAVIEKKTMQLEHEIKTLTSVADLAKEISIENGIPVVPQAVAYAKMEV